MIQRGDGACFVLQTNAQSRIDCILLGQDLERCPAPEPRIVSKEYLTHSSPAQEGDNLVLAKLLPDERSIARVQPINSNVIGRLLQKIARMLVGGEKRFDLPARVIVLSAGIVDERCSSGRAVLGSLQEHIHNSAVAFRRHWSNRVSCPSRPNADIARPWRCASRA